MVLSAELKALFYFISKYYSGMSISHKLCIFVVAVSWLQIRGLNFNILLAFGVYKSVIQVENTNSTCGIEHNNLHKLNVYSMR